MGNHVVFKSCGGILELQREIQTSSCVGPMKTNLPFELRGRDGCCSRVTVGQNRPHLGFCPGHNVPLQGQQGSRGCIPDSPEVRPRLEGKQSTLLSSRDRYLLEPIEWPKGSKASCEVWRKDQGLLSRSGRKRSPQSRDDGGFSRAAAPVWGFSRGMTGSSGSLSCGAREVRCPCAWRGGACHCSRVMVGESGLKTR